MKLFEAEDPRGHRIVLTRERWNHITRHKIKDPKRLERCIRNPEEIRQSDKNPEAHIYYRSTDSRHLCVIVHIEEGFITTAYETTYRKGGDVLWSQNR